MRFSFVPFGGKAPPGAAGCDGLVSGALIDLSHWGGNQTPKQLKRDTSVEIALAFNQERDAHDVAVVTNNHFDADGVLACWALLRPQLAAEHAALIVAAAEAGDFDAWPSDDRGLWLESAISKLAQGDDRARYDQMLPQLDALVPSIERREDLWGASYAALLAAKKTLDSGAVSIFHEGRIAVIVHAPQVSELPGPWISRLVEARADRLMLVFQDRLGGFRYRYELPRYAWADTVQRPAIPVPKRGRIRRKLGADWIVKGRLSMTGLAYTSGPIPDAPQQIARALAELEASPSSA